MFGRWAHYGMPSMSPATIFGLQSPAIRAQPQVASAEFRHSVDLSSFNIALHETEAFPAMRGQLVSPATTNPLRPTYTSVYSSARNRLPTTHMIC
ncbi:hypothetical protein FKD14_03000 [Bifidobacterium breve]|nr:hypothetical protein CE156_00330 [Bifidobacterium breve]RDX26496.1 hypothetical protein CE160_02725 [Bifidobacterium breve]TQC89945.1 hypothetical protein FKD14_03000 [Bifidobacterium breve]